MEAPDALLIVDALDQALVRYWITGGWGVDALAGGPGGWVDLHPVDFGGGRTGIQQGMDGTDFRYPAADLTTGRINDRALPCISVRLQIHFHCGYEPRDQDRHDLELLAGLERPSWAASEHSRSSQTVSTVGTIIGRRR